MTAPIVGETVTALMFLLSSALDAHCPDPDAWLRKAALSIAQREAYDPPDTPYPR